MMPEKAIFKGKRDEFIKLCDELKVVYPNAFEWTFRTRLWQVMLYDYTKKHKKTIVKSIEILNRWIEDAAAALKEAQNS